MAKRGRPKKVAKWQRWSRQEVAQLRRIFRNISNDEVAKQLGRSVTSVQNKAFQLGLRKSRKYMKSIGLAK